MLPIAHIGKSFWLRLMVDKKYAVVLLVISLEQFLFNLVENSLG